MKPTMKKLICIVIVALGVSSTAFSQSKSKSSSYQSKSYTSAIGIRMGTGYYDLFSASFKVFLAETPGAIELNLGFKPRSYGYYYTGNNYHADVFNLSFSASYQYHFDIPPAPGLKWFIGGGLTGYESFVNNSDVYKSGFGFGLFPTGGADYKFNKIPLNVSVDFRPTFIVTRPNDLYSNFAFSVGASARYTF